MVNESAPKSTLRLLGIFQAISEFPSGMTLAKLSSTLDTPKSSLLNLLRSLVDQDYLTHENGIYTLGPRIYNLAASILAHRKQPAVIRQHALELAEATRETVIIATIDHSTGLTVYVDVIESPQSVRYTVPPGVTRPLYCSAAGRLLLALQPEDWRENYLQRVEFRSYTPSTVTDRAELRSILADIARTGIAYSSDQAVEGAAGLAAPIWGADRSLAAAITVAAPSGRLNQNRVALRRELIKAAARASEALGYRPATAVA